MNPTLTLIDLAGATVLLVWAFTWSKRDRARWCSLSSTGRPGARRA
jgi:hypothetical protein